MPDKTKSDQEKKTPTTRATKPRRSPEEGSKRVSVTMSSKPAPAGEVKITTGGKHVAPRSSRTWERLSVLKTETTTESPDEHFGERLIAALQALPDDMKNDPAYADPVAWVKRARENTAPPDDSDDQ